ncbi:hypothetical protein MASR1M68_10500 [Elusimicrobiota bacterium]
MKILSKILLITAGLVIAVFLLEIFLQITSFSIHKYKYYKMKEEIKKETDLTIACIGESTTDGQWPKFLEQALVQKGIKKQIKVIDCGLGGADTDALIKYIKDNIYNLKPKYIVAMMGINDKNDMVLKTKKIQLKTFALFFMITEHVKSRFFSENDDFTLKLKQADDYFINKKYRKAVKIYKYLNEKYPHRKKEFVTQWIINNKILNRTKEVERIVLELAEEDPYYNIFEVIEIFCTTKNIDMLKKLFPTDKPEKLKPIVYNDIGVFLKLREELLAVGMKDLVSFVDNMVDELTVHQSNRNLKYSYYNNILGYQAMKAFMKEDYETAEKFYAVQTKNLTDNMPKKTRNNYKILAELCKNHGITLVVMQYPNRSISPLETLLKDYDEIVFVSNEQNFKEKLKTTSYKDIFKDLFAGDFGHCTDLGNLMIADNLADTLVKLIN